MTSERNEVIIREELETIPYTLPASLCNLHAVIDEAIASRKVDAGSAKDFDSIIVSAFVETRDSLKEQCVSHANFYELREAERSLLIQKALRVRSAAAEERDLAAAKLKELYLLKERKG